MRYLAAQYIDWPDEMEQLADNISDHLNRKREFRENKSQMTPAEIRQAWRLEVRRFNEEDRRVRTAWDQRERQEAEQQEQNRQKREQHNLQRLERLAKKQEEQEDA